MPAKTYLQLQIGDVVHGDERRGSWFRITSKKTSRNRVDVSGDDIDTGEPASTWGTPNSAVDVLR